MYVPPLSLASSAVYHLPAGAACVCMPPLSLASSAVYHLPAGAPLASVRRLWHHCRATSAPMTYWTAWQRCSRQCMRVRENCGEAGWRHQFSKMFHAHCHAVDPRCGYEGSDIWIGDVWMQVPHAPLLVLTAGLVDPEYRFMLEGHPLQKNPAPKSVSLTPPPPFWSSPQGSLIPSASPSSGALTVSFPRQAEVRRALSTVHVLYFSTVHVLYFPDPLAPDHATSHPARS